MREGDFIPRKRVSRQITSEWFIRQYELRRLGQHQVTGGCEDNGISSASRFAQLNNPVHLAVGHSGQQLTPKQ